MKRSIACIGIFLLAAAVSLAGITSASAYSAEEPLVLRCGSSVIEDSNPGVAMKEFREFLEEKTGGRVKIQNYWNGTLGNERDMIEALSLGSLEMALCSTAPLVNFSPSYMIWDLPYIVENTREGLDSVYKIMDSEIGRSMLDSTVSQNVKGLFLAHNGFRYTINRVKDVKTPADIKGLKIRTMENGVHLAFYTAVGANPTPMASTEAFTALEQGVIDGMDNNLDSFWSQGAYNSSKHLTLTGHIFSAATCLIANDVFNSMTPEDQKIFMEGAQIAADSYRKAAEDRTNLAIDFMKSQGVTFTEVNIADWRTPEVLAIWDTYRDQIDQKYFDALAPKK